MAERTGLAAIVAEAGAGALLELDTAEQLALEIGLDPARIRRQVGRPAGRRNLRVQRTADYLLARYRDPLEGLVAMAAMPLTALAETLGCTLLQAAEEQRLCRVAALPYLHQRQAIAVDVTNVRTVQLTIVQGLDEAVPDEDLAISHVVEIQGVIDAPDASV